MKSRKSLVLSPSLKPLSLEEVKGFLKIDVADEDVLLNALIDSATERLQDYLNIKIMYQKWAIYFDCFGVSRNPKADNYDSWSEGYIPDLFSTLNYLELPIGNIQRIESFKTYDDDNEYYLFDKSNYNVDLYTTPARIALKRNSVWPATVLRTLNGVEIIVEVGWVTQDEVPAPIKQALRLYIAQMYESRGDDTNEENRRAIPTAALALIDHLKLYRI
jgi:hypothetical protein